MVRSINSYNFNAEKQTKTPLITLFEHLNQKCYRLLSNYHFQLHMKQAILVRSDIKMTPGKLAAQVAHASLSAYLKTDNADQRLWKSEGQTKIVLKVSDESVLFTLKELAKRNNIPTALIRDAGRTQLEPGTITSLGVGPANDSDVDNIVRDFSLY
tara:strand:- start:244 stop:711 length:468 start_codon:yes stop_codon:yes gene_type:complete